MAKTSSIQICKKFGLNHSGETVMLSNGHRSDSDAMEEERGGEVSRTGSPSSDGKRLKAVRSVPLGKQRRKPFSPPDATDLSQKLSVGLLQPRRTQLS